MPSDKTPSAIVAADRLALSEATEGKELLHRRLIVFYGYFALLGTLGTLTGHTKRILVDVDPGVLTFVLQVQGAHALLLCAIFVALRFRVRELHLVVRAPQIVATVMTMTTVFRSW